MLNSGLALYVEPQLASTSIPIPVIDTPKQLESVWAPLERHSNKRQSLYTHSNSSLMYYTVVCNMTHV